MSGLVDRLKLVTNQRPETTDDTQLYISGGVDNPVLSYVDKTDGNDVDSLVVEYKKTAEKPIKCSELNTRLKNRYWNKVDCCRYIDSNGDIYYRTYGLDIEDSGNTAEGAIDIIQKDIIDSSNNIKDSEKIFKINQNNFSSEEKNLIIDMYNSKVSGEIKETKLQQPNRVVEEIIKPDSSTYTDILEIGSRYSDILNRKYVRAELTIQYSINDDTNIYCKDVVVDVLHNINSEVVIRNTIEDINGKVRVEHINGVIRVCPISDSVNECIISRCTLIYGK